MVREFADMPVSIDGRYQYTIRARTWRLDGADPISITKSRIVAVAASVGTFRVAVREALIKTWPGMQEILEGSRVRG